MIGEENKKIKISNSPAYLVLEVKVFDDEGSIICDPYMIPATLNCQNLTNDLEYSVEALVCLKNGTSIADSVYYANAKKDLYDGSAVWFEFEQDIYGQVELGDVLEIEQLAQLLVYKLTKSEPT